MFYLKIKNFFLNFFFLIKNKIGIWEGKLLERGKYKNAENNNQVFCISDFEIKKSVKINSFSFHIVDADDFTKKWLSENLN